jgi:hypothetical protein
VSLDLNELAAGIKDALSPLLARGVNVYSLIPGAPILPCVIVVPQGDFVSYHEDLGEAHALVQFTLRVYVGGDEQGLRLLYELMSAGIAVDHSVADVIERARPTRGGTGFGAQASDVLALTGRWLGYLNLSRDEASHNVPAWGAEIPLRIHLRKDTR